MANTSIIKGSVLPNSASKNDIYDLIDDAVASVSDIVNTDIKSDAAIVDSKLATISTAGKVNLSALTIAGQTEGDILYSADGVTFSRLPIGTAGQKLEVNYDIYTKLMLHADGIDGATTFTDDIGKTVTNTASFDSYTKLMLHLDNNVTDSALGKTVTNNNVTFSDTVKKWGYSGVFNGSTGNLTVPDSADWNLGSGDYTVDFWVRFVDITGTQVFFGQYKDATHYIYWGWEGTNTVNQVYEDGGAQVQKQSSWTPTVNTWYHLAWARSGNDLKFFVNGVQQGATLDVTGKTLPDVDATFIIGMFNSLYGIKGYIDELRVNKGIARWTADFTPETSAYAPSLGWQTP